MRNWSVASTHRPTARQRTCKPSAFPPHDHAHVSALASLKWLPPLEFDRRPCKQERRVKAMRGSSRVRGVYYAEDVGHRTPNECVWTVFSRWGQRVGRADNSDWRYANTSTSRPEVGAQGSKICTNVRATGAISGEEHVWPSWAGSARNIHARPSRRMPSRWCGLDVFQTKACNGRPHDRPPLPASGRLWADNRYPGPISGRPEASKSSNMPSEPLLRIFLYREALGTPLEATEGERRRGVLRRGRRRRRRGGGGRGRHRRLLRLRSQHRCNERAREPCAISRPELALVGPHMTPEPGSPRAVLDSSSARNRPRLGPAVKARIHRPSVASERGATFKSPNTWPRG